MIVAGFIAAVIAIGEASRAAKNRKIPTALEQCGAQNQGNGIWYFRCDGKVLASALSEFRDKYPDLRVVSVSIAVRKSTWDDVIVITEPLR